MADLKFEFAMREDPPREVGPLWSAIVGSVQMLKRPKDAAEHDGWTTVETLASVACKILIDKQYSFWKSVFAIQDGVNPNRFFMGFTTRGSFTLHHVMGCIVYFDASGTAKECQPLRTEVCSYDYRNGPLDHEAGCLVNQSLVFACQHRDSRNLELTVNLLSYDDQILAQQDGFYTTFQGGYFAFERATKYPRFLYGSAQPDSGFDHILVDVGSLHKTPTGRYALTYTTFPSSTTSAELDACACGPACSGLKGKYPAYGDGYPEACVRCGLKTVNATINSRGLGFSFCFPCLIRFSASWGQWQCCRNAKKTTDGGYAICETGLSADFQCAAAHGPDVELNCQITRQSLKFPFRQFVQLTSKSKGLKRTRSPSSLL